LATFENNTIKLNTIGFIKVNKSEYVGHNTQEQERGVISTGSGFFLGENGNCVVTNKHVVDLSKNQLYCIKIRYKNGDSILIRRFRIVVQDEKADLAILKKVEDDDLRGDTLVLNLNLKPRLGMEIESYGFPSPGVLGLDVQRNVGTVTRSYGSNKRLAFIQTDLPAWYGYSGGAAYGSSGNLVGVITSMVYDGKEKIENVTYLSAAENLLPLLKKSDIAYEISNVEDNSGTKIEDLAKRAVLIAIEQCKK
jgi:S1-C subfamily serine protease